MNTVLTFMSDSVSGRAYAKINLALRITGLIGDKHAIESLQQSIDLYDEITLTTRKDGAVTSDFSGDNSLVVLSALQRAFGLGGMHLSVKKHIPIGGGLGGSSADAAAAAKAAAELFGLDKTKVFAAVKDLFGDIAFQMTMGTALTSGTGSDVTPLAPLPRYHVLLVFPTAGVSTKEAYALSDSYPHAVTDVQKVYRALAAGDSAQEHYVNDLIPAAEKLNGEIAPLLAAMQDPASLLTGMSGSGSTLFALYKNKESAEKKAREIALPTLVTTTFSPLDLRK